MVSGSGTTAITAARSPCSAAAELHYLVLRIFLPILSRPLLRIAVQNPNFCPCRGSLSTLFFLFSSSSAHYGVASRPALCPLLFSSSRFSLQARSLLSRLFIPHAPFDLRAYNRRPHLPTSAVSKHAFFRHSIVIPDAP